MRSRKLTLRWQTLRLASKLTPFQPQHLQQQWHQGEHEIERSSAACAASVLKLGHRLTAIPLASVCWYMQGRRRARLHE